MRPGSVTAVALRHERGDAHRAGTSSAACRSLARSCGGLARSGPARAGACTEPADLGPVKSPGAAALELIEADGADPHPDESIDRRTDGAEHPTQLAFPALGQDRAVPDKLTGWRREDVDEA